MRRWPMGPTIFYGRWLQLAWSGAYGATAKVTLFLTLALRAYVFFRPTGNPTANLLLWVVPLVVFLLSLTIGLARAPYVILLQVEEERVKLQAALSEGELRFDIDKRATCTYPYPNKCGRYVFLYGTIRSSGPAAVRIMEMRLSDANGRDYPPVTPPGKIQSIGANIVLEPDARFDPSGIFILEPNRPQEIVAVFQADHEEWHGPTPTVDYTLVMRDDHGRSLQIRFSCRVHRGDAL